MAIEALLADLEWLGAVVARLDDEPPPAPGVWLDSELERLRGLLGRPDGRHPDELDDALGSRCEAMQATLLGAASVASWRGRRGTPARMPSGSTVENMLAKDSREGGFCLANREKFPSIGVKGLNAVIADGVGYGYIHSLAFLGQHMNDHRPLGAFDAFKSVDQGGHIMPIDGANIDEAIMFKKGCWAD